MKIIMSIVVVAFVLGIVGITTGLECYKCTYRKNGEDVSDKRCKEDPKKVGTEVCRGTFPHCFKFSASSGNREVIIRGCSNERKSGVDECEGDKIYPGESDKGRLCKCDGNKCNSATATSALTFLPLVGAISYALH